eukprot:PITA_14305
MEPPKSTAEGWKYVEKLDGPHGRHLKCKLCNNEYFGSLTRVMDHLLSVTNGKGGGVEGCKNVSAELKETLQKDYDNIQKAKKVNENKRQRVQTEITMNYNSFSALSSSTVGVGISSQSKIGKSSGTTTLNSLSKPMQKQEVDDVVADMFFESAIPFNVARSPYFINVCKMMASFGKGYVPPSSETIRTTFLKRSKERVTNNLQKIKDSWKETGCTILSDGWSDMNHRPFINVLVYCPKEVLFFKVVDASGNKKTSEFIVKILEEAILEVGEENVVQIITDSASNCVEARKMIMDKYRKIYWTPCAAHCLNLLLHDLAKFPWINETVRRGKQISHFIFNHQLTLSLYRNNASRELLRPCDTRFATYYIIIKRLVEEKRSIRGVFCNNEWEKSHHSKEAKGKELEQVILGNAFWDNAHKVLKVREPIVDMLHMVDSDTPSMGIVYEGMDCAKEAIAKSFNNEENEYIAIWEMIDERWKMLHSSLHAAACYLDPRLFGLEDLVYVRSNLKLALSSVAKDASSSSQPWFDADIEPEEDDISTDGDSLDEPNVGIPFIDDFDDHHSSPFTMPSAHDD